MKKYLFFAVLTTAVLAACKKTLAVEPAYQAPDSSYGLIYNKIFAPTCALSGCHAQEDHTAHAHAVTLAGNSAYDALINGATKNSQAAAAGLKLIIPRDTVKSFLYQKIIYSRAAHKYGSPMPTGGLKLTANQIEFVKQWIMAGAPKEGHVVDKALMN
jgi:hypothetical protein